MACARLGLARTGLHLLPQNRNPRQQANSILKPGPSASALRHLVMPSQSASMTVHVAASSATAAPDSAESLSSAHSSTASALKPLRAILFDVDGTLADSDPLHFLAFQEMLQEVGFNGGVPITEAFFKQRISGGHNPDIMRDLFPLWDLARQEQFTLEKEARFRRMALSKIEAVEGLHRFCDWVRDQGVLRAAVTNAPRENAEQMIRGLGLSEFFQHLVIGAECERAKPFPDPYLRGMELLGVTAEECIAIEDSPAGTRAAVAAGVPTVGVLTGQTRDVLMEAGTFMTMGSYSDPAFWKYINSRKPTRASNGSITC